jgi:hypothetical protein
VEFSVPSVGAIAPMLSKLLSGLREDHLAAVSIGRLMHDADRAA